MSTPQRDTFPCSSSQLLPDSRRLTPLRVRLGILLGTVAALAVPTILHVLVLLDEYGGFSGALLSFLSLERHRHRTRVTLAGVRRTRT